MAAFVLLPRTVQGHPSSLTVGGTQVFGTANILVGGTAVWHIEQDVPGTTEYTLQPISGSNPGAVTVVADAHHSTEHPNDVEYLITGVSAGSATVSVFWQHYNPDGTEGESSTFQVNIGVFDPPVFTAISPGTGSNFLVGDASANNSLNFTASADFPGSSQFFTTATFNGANHTSFSHGNGEFVYDIFGSAPVGTGTGAKDITIFVQSNLGFSDQRTFSVNVAENTLPSNIEVDSPVNGSTVVVANVNTSNTIGVSGSFVDPDQNLSGVTVNGINATFAAVGNTGEFGFSQDVIVSGAGSQFITVQVNDDFGAASVQRSFNLEQNQAPSNFDDSACSGSSFLVADASISNNLPCSGTFTDTNLNITQVQMNSTPCSFSVDNSVSGSYSYDCSVPLAAGAGNQSVFWAVNDEVGATTQGSFSVNMVQNTAPTNLVFTPANSSDLPSNDIDAALSILVSGTFDDPDQNLSSVAVNGVNASFSTVGLTGGHSFSTNVDLAAGTGSRDINVVLTDGLGGTLSQTNTVNVVESFGPAGIIFTPADGGQVVVADATQDNSVSVSGTVTDRDLNLSSVTVNNILFTAHVDNTNDGTYSYSGSVTAPGNTSSFPITVQAQDATGQTASLTNTAIVEQNTAPTSITHDLADGDRVLVADATQANGVNVSGTVYDDNGNLSGVTVNGIAASFSASASAPSGNGGAFRQSYHYNIFTTLHAGSGNQSVNIAAIDQLGLQASTSFNVNVVQNTPPASLSVTPADGSDILVADATQANNVVFSGTVVDPDLNLNSVSINSTLMEVHVDNTAGGVYAFSGGVSLTAGAGPKTVEVEVSDAPFPVPLRQSLFVNIRQNSSPTGVSFTPSDGSSVFFPISAQSLSLPVSGSVTDVDGNLSGVTVDGTSLVFAVDNTAGGSYSYSGSINVPITTPTGFQQPVTVRFVDALGASVEQTNTVNILPVPPPTVSSVSPNSIDHSSSTGASVQGSDFQSGATVSVGGVDASASFINSSTISISVPSGSPGPVDVVVTNPDGQSGTLANGFTYTVTQTQPTSTGSNVPVSLPVPAGKVAAPTVTFSDVSSAGTTTLTTSSAPPSGGSTPPSGFQIGDAPVYYDLSTTASFSGTVELCFNYANTSLAGISNEDRLKLFHFVSSVWTDITTSVNTSTKEICGSTTSFSPFAIFTPTLAVPVPVPFSGASTTDFTPTLDWNDATGAVTYNLEWADNGSFASSTVISNLSASEYTFTVSLADGTYFWRVQSVDASNNTSAYSTVDSFVIIPTFAEWTAIFVAAAMLLYLAFHRLGLRR